MMLNTGHGPLTIITPHLHHRHTHNKQAATTRRPERKHIRHQHPMAFPAQAFVRFAPAAQVHHGRLPPSPFIDLLVEGGIALGPPALGADGGGGAGQVPHNLILTFEQEAGEEWAAEPGDMVPEALLGELEFVDMEE